MALTAKEEAELTDKLGAALLAAGRLVAKAKAAGDAASAEYQSAVAAEAAISHEIFERLPDRSARAVVGKVDTTLRKERPSKWIIG